MKWWMRDWRCLFCLLNMGSGSFFFSEVFKKRWGHFKWHLCTSLKNFSFYLTFSTIVLIRKYLHKCCKIIIIGIACSERAKFIPPYHHVTVYHSNLNNSTITGTVLMHISTYANSPLHDALMNIIECLLVSIIYMKSTNPKSLFFTWC